MLFGNLIMIEIISILSDINWFNICGIFLWSVYLNNLKNLFLVWEDDWLLVILLYKIIVFKD